MLRQSGFIAAADLKNMLRQRETIMWVFVMPIVFFYFVGTITGGAGDPRGSAERPDALVVLAPDGPDVIVEAIVAGLERQHFAVTRTTSPAAASAAVRALTLPTPAAGSVSDAVRRREVQAITYRSRAEGPGAQFERVRIGKAIYKVLANLAVVTLEGSPVSAESFRALNEAPRALSVTIESATRLREAPTGFAQAIPGTMVMFTMLVSLTSGAILLIIERRLGLLRRLASAPIARGSVVAGKWLGRWVLAMMQIGFAMLAGTLLFGVRWGDAVPMVFALLLTWAAFNASLGLLLGNLARTEGQMVGIGVISSMAMGALGGCWWPIEIAPRWMQGLAMALPTGWAMNGLHHLVSFGDPALSVVPHMLALSVGAVLLAIAAARVFRFE